jgi:hypothetical protein
VAAYLESSKERNIAYGPPRLPRHRGGADAEGPAGVADVARPAVGGGSGSRTTHRGRVRRGLGRLRPRYWPVSAPNPLAGPRPHFLLLFSPLDEVVRPPWTYESARVWRPPPIWAADVAGSGGFRRGSGLAAAGSCAARLCARFRDRLLVVELKRDAAPSAAFGEALGLAVLEAVGRERQAVEARHSRSDRARGRAENGLEAGDVLALGIVPSISTGPRPRAQERRVDPSGGRGDLDRSE